MNDLDQFTSTELDEMHIDTYQRALDLFEQADRLLGQLAGLPYPSPAYTSTKASERTAMAAATEAHELLRAIGAELRTRQENANA